MINNKFMGKEKKHKLIVIILLATFFGMSAGIVGDLVSRVYVLDNAYNLPFFGEINFSNGVYGGSNIIIRDPRKVIVEQNDKVLETVNAVKSSLVGIYPKNLESDLKKDNDGKKAINLADYYKIGLEAGQGFIVTSDGWIISSFKPENLNYVVITENKEIYQIDRIEKDSLTPYYFLHIAAKDLPVRKLAERSEIKNGQLVLMLNWMAEVDSDIIISANETGNKYLFFSDYYSGKIALSGLMKDRFKNSFLFNLSGDIIGMIDASGEVEPIYHFKSAINTLLKYKSVKRPSLGVNYINLSKLVYSFPSDESMDRYKKGALVYKNNSGIAVVKNSAAEKAGLTEGDIIASVESVEINNENDLTEIIQGYSAGDSVKIVFIRDDAEHEINIILGEIK